jgi:cobalt-zinc-cadmium efflux system protein
VYIADSVALFSDVIHIASDTLSYLAAIAVIGIASAFPTYTQKSTLIGVGLIFILLVVGDVFIFRETVHRMFIPHAVAGLPTLAAASAGLVLNAIVLFISRRTPKHEQNIRHASIDAHALSDLLISVAVIVSAGIIWLTGWNAADWIVALAVAYYLLWWPILNIARRIVRGNIGMAKNIAHGHGHKHEH